MILVGGERRTAHPTQASGHDLDQGMCRRGPASILPRTTRKATAMTRSPATAAAGADEIREIVGEVDDANEEIGNELERLPRGAVGAVYEISRSQEPESDER